MTTSHDHTALGGFFTQVNLGLRQTAKTLAADEGPLAAEAAGPVTPGAGPCRRCGVGGARRRQCCHLHHVVDAALGGLGRGLRVHQGTDVLGCLEAL